MGSCCLCALNRGLENLGVSLKKVLIVAVRSCHCGVLIRGLRNLDAPCKGDVFTFFLRRAKRIKKHARTHKKLPVASFCASETAETGRIANGREQGDHVSRRLRFANLWGTFGSFRTSEKNKSVLPFAPIQSLFAAVLQAKPVSICAAGNFCKITSGRALNRPRSPEVRKPQSP